MPSFRLFLFLVLATTPITIVAAPAPLAERSMPIGIESGSVEAAKSARGLTVVFSTEIDGDGAPWMRLYFADVVLAGNPSQGTGSFLRITSVSDGSQQTLDALEVSEWSESSAYFNGDKLLLELLAFPGTGANRVTVASATVEDPDTVITHRAVCGEADDRVPSADPQVGRLMPVGCTAFLIGEGDCANRFLTAGHCLVSQADIVQFNVPPSLFTGSLQHPPPQDQYLVDAASRQAISLGIGDDFGTFVTLPNTETGLAPRTAQGAAHHLSAYVPSSPQEYWRGIRIAGYGVDDGTANQTHQTDTGPLLRRDGNRLRHLVDEEGGSSGSPMINAIDGKVVGIDTHSGCDNPALGSNVGTAVDHPRLLAMLANGPLGTCMEHEYCVPDASWIPPGADDWSDAEHLDAWYDLANCYVHHLDVANDGSAFILGNGYYVTPGPNGICEQGWHDGANCFLGWAPAFRIPFFWNGAFYYIE